MKAAVIAGFLLLIASASCKNLDKEEDLQEENDVRGGYDNVVTDPCASKHCGAGKECDLDEEQNPVCVCIHQCPKETNARAKVCSTKNVTFDSECELYRQKCLCRRRQAGCTEPQNKHAHLDYYGECKEIPECLDYELEEYPKRMRQWFFLVMEELASRSDLKSSALKMAQKAKQHSKKWLIPVIWKFCDLDVSHDRMITTDELLPISAPLKTLEHCTGPFLESCDEDGSGDISLQEWGQCLGLENDEIEDLCDGLDE